MFAALAKSLDWLVIRGATALLPRNEIHAARAAHLDRFIEDPSEFLQGDPGLPHLDFSNPRDFTFKSPIQTSWPENNTAAGKLYRCGHDLGTHPTVILLHGWNDSVGYALRLPLFARLLNRAGMNAIIPKLPYHGPRRPRAPDAMRDFISSDPARMLEAARQAVMEIRALITWLLDHKAGPVGLVGISLGGWLGGLALCSDDRLHFGVLITPIASIDRAIRDLPFCEPIRNSIRNHPMQLDQLDLKKRTPMPPPERILLVSARHDLFLPPEEINPLARSWNNPEVWHFAHGHISIAFSLRLARRMVNWIKATL